ncbi:MAG: hypothetical protein EA368_04295 [Leptolyngbya sp. DLM2.Bin27]|nr:MAG: hypothetical protein EA368_04295 [Leptolyngbya sp. DLM2.Bin27]
MKGILSFFVVFLAVGFLLFQLFSTVSFAFGESSVFGLRSLAAALFPLIVSAYISFVAQLQIPTRESRAPVINSFVTFLFWTTIILGIDTGVQIVEFPIEELLYSLTLATLLWRYRRSSFSSLVACCYGILAGILASVIIFGTNFVRI